MKRMLTSSMWTWVIVLMALLCLVAGNQQIQTVHGHQERLELTTLQVAAFNRLEQCLWDLEAAFAAAPQAKPEDLDARIEKDLKALRGSLEEAKRLPFAESEAQGSLLRLETAVILLEREGGKTTPATAGHLRRAMQEVRSGSGMLWARYTEIAREIASRWQEVNLLVLASCVMAAFLAFLLRAFHRDLMERKDAERALRESEERYRRLVEASPDAILVHRGGKILFVNSSGVDLLGAVSASMLVGSDMRELSPNAAAWGQVPDGAGPARPQHYPVVRKDGKKIEVEAVATSFAYQESPAVQMMIRDVTAIRQQSEKLAASERRFRSLFENVAEGVYQSSENGQILEANRALVEMLGYESLEELKRLNIAADLYVDSGDREESTQVLQSEGSVNNLELRLRRKDGTVITVLENARAVTNAAGEVEFYEGTLTDISQLKQAEETLKQARDQALRVSRMKSEFLANVSHEIRTPMNGIIGMADLLNDTSLSSEQREYAEAVRRSAHYLLNIINDILDFSKIEAGRLELEEIEFDPRECVEDVVELLAERAQEKGLELLTQIDSQLPARLRGDPYRIQQILTNLLGNAIKFTNAGEVLLRVRCENRGPESARVYAEVADTGIGVPEAMREKLFLPFTQADGSFTRRFGGTGLGLAITRQLVELMGGEVGMRAAEAGGSVFWFAIPLRVVEVAPATAGRRGGGKALVATQHPERGATYAHSLRELGYAVSRAHSGQELLLLAGEALAQRQPYDLILADHHLNDTSSIALAQHLQQEGVDPSRTLIRLVRWRERALERLNDEHFAGTLPEPNRRAQFLAAIESLEEGRAALGGLAELGRRLEESSPSAPPVRVAIAEDNAINQRVALRMLEKLGVAADVFENGRLAYEAIRRGGYGLVFMDCQMPEMDGFQATEAIRAWEAQAGLARLPIIAMTAHAMQGDRERCLEAGMDDYLAKPISRTGLEDILLKWLPSYGEGELAFTSDSSQTA